MTASKAARKAASLRKGKRECRHVRLYAWELESHAYRSLGLGARCLLVELKALYNGANNGSLHMSIREAASRLGTGKDQAAAAFRDLEDRGFIVATRWGAMARRSQNRLATTWRLAEFEDDVSGHAATRDFMSWRPHKPRPKKIRAYPQPDRAYPQPDTDPPKWP